MSKEPGQLAYETAAHANNVWTKWEHLGFENRASWARVEAAIRANERANLRASAERGKELVDILEDADLALNLPGDNCEKEQVSVRIRAILDKHKAP
jgi:hypothetical protein